MYFIGPWWRPMKATWSPVSSRTSLRTASFGLRFVRGDPLEGAIPYAFCAKLGVPYLCIRHNPQPQVLVADCSSLRPKLFPQTSDEAYQFTRDSWWARPDSNRRPSGLSRLWL